MTYFTVTFSDSTVHRIFAHDYMQAAIIAVAEQIHREGSCLLISITDRCGRKLNACECYLVMRNMPRPLREKIMDLVIRILFWAFLLWFTILLTLRLLT